MADNLLAQIVRQLTRKTGAPSTTFARTGIVTPRRDMVDRSGDNPQYQDVTIGEETPTPRTGVTLDQMARVPTGVFRPASPEQESSPANILFQKIQELQGKDYSKTKSESGETVYGKDYDKTHNIKDVFRGMGLGALTNIANAKIDYSNPNINPLAQVLGAGLGGAAGGGIGAGINRNADNKMLDQIKLAQMVPQYNQAYGIERQRTEDAQNDRIKDAQAVNLEGQPEFKERQARLAEAKVALQAQHNEDLLNYRREVADRLHIWRTRKLEAEIEGNKVKADLAERKLQELIRNNKATEEGRNKRAVTSQEAQDRRTQIAIEAKRTLAEYQEAQRNGRAEKAAELRLKLAGLKTENDELDEPLP